MKLLDQYNYVSDIADNRYSGQIFYGKIRVDTDACRVSYEDVIVPLLPQEYKLLRLFLKYPNQVLSYEVIVERLWEGEKCPSPSTIRSHIKGIRKAFNQVTGTENIIETVHGLGYRLQPAEKQEGDHPRILPAMPVMQSFLQAKGIEYAVIDDNLMIRYISSGVADYCDYPELLRIGTEVVSAFPELIGLEETCQEIINNEYNNFQVKGIGRAANPARPEYINLYIVGDNGNKVDSGGDKFLFIFFEDASEHMLCQQRVAQVENEFYFRSQPDRLSVFYDFRNVFQGGTEVTKWGCREMGRDIKISPIAVF